MDSERDNEFDNDFSSEDKNPETSMGSDADGSTQGGVPISDIKRHDIGTGQSPISQSDNDDPSVYDVERESSTPGDQQNETLGQPATSQDISKTPASEMVTSANNSVVTSGSGLEGSIPVKKSKKKLIIFGVVIAILIVILGIATSAYMLWYQNPKKVFADAITNAIKADTVDMSTSSTVQLSKPKNDYANMPVESTYPDKLTVKTDLSTNYTSAKVSASTSYSQKGKDYNFNVAAQIDEEGTAHINVDKFKQGIEEALKAQGTSLKAAPKAVQDLVNKLDGNWLRVGAEDIASFDEAAAKQYKKTYSCVVKAYKDFRESDVQQQEMIDLYIKNNPIVEMKDIGTKDGNIGYEITLDDKKIEQISKDSNKTTVAKAVDKCFDTKEGSKSMSTFESQTTTDTKSEKAPKVVLTVWISQFGHEMTGVEMKVKDDTVSFEADTSLSYNKPFALSAPDKVVTLKSLKSEIEALFLSLYQSLSDTAKDASKQSDALNTMNSKEAYSTGVGGRI
jgi:hypothetical protein